LRQHSENSGFRTESANGLQVQREQDMESHRKIQPNGDLAVDITSYTWQSSYQDRLSGS